MDCRDYVATKPYDVITAIYVHLPEADRRPFHAALTHSLKPGGYILVEAFTKRQIQYSSGGPKDEGLLYSLTDLLQDFPGLNILKAEETETTLDEGSFHHGEASVLRIIAQHKPFR